MFRSLYRCVLRLHPSRFRKRFADEMLSIFDQGAGKSAPVKLLLDGLVSLVRQWTLRPEFWRDVAPAPQPAPEGIPSFSTLDPFRPRAGAVIHGLVLSTAIFCLTCFAIRYSWIHVLHVHIPEVQFDIPLPIQPSAISRQHAISATSPLPPAEQAQITLAPPGLPISMPKQANRAPIAAQDRIAESPTASDPQSQVSPAARVATVVTNRTAHPKHRLVPQSAEPSDHREVSLQALAGSGLLRAQDQSLMPLADAGALAQAPTGDGNLDSAERRRVLDRAIANLKKYYFDRDVAEKTSDALTAHEKDGDDNAATEGAVFADLLTMQMQATSHDMHLIMEYSRDTLPEHPPKQTSASLARYRQAMEQENCMFKKVEILPHNIGYLKLDFFPDTSVCESTATTAMASLNDVDAIIFDLRDTTGGFPNMVTLIASYLFDHPEYIYSPRGAPTEESWTGSPVPGNRLADKPVYVLISASTWSGAEQFSYDLKMLKRATLVGETTRGGTHAGVFHRIDDHFGMGIPEEKAINPFGKTDWEGTGVEPDVKVKAADALQMAQQLATKTLQH
jgi:hypothetical protein